MNALSQRVHGKDLVAQDVSSKYTGEAIGVEFFHNDAGMTLLPVNLDEQIDEGFFDVDTKMASDDGENLDKFPVTSISDENDDTSADDNGAEANGVKMKFFKYSFFSFLSSDHQICSLFCFQLNNFIAHCL